MPMTPDHGCRQWRPSSSRPPEPTVNKIIFVDKDAAVRASHTLPTGVFQGSNPAPTNDANAMAMRSHFTDMSFSTLRQHPASTSS
jgi:hypothetical protein